MAKILLTGATGFIGKRLLRELLANGHEVYALTRIKGVGVGFEHPLLHVIFGDIRDPLTMDLWPEDIEAAYYLIHSMGDVAEHLLSTEVETCQHFLAAIERTRCRQIIFLGGIIEDAKTLSPHLQSRLAVEAVLKSGKVPCTILRASIILGSGSASFEIIRDLVEKLPVMIAPKWVKSYCQPIDIRDVLFYLNGVLLNETAFGKNYDIGGPIAMTFREALLGYAKFRHLKRWIIDVGVLTPRLSSYWLVFITSVRFSICKYLIESMKQNTRKLNLAIDELLPHQCLTYEESLKRAFQKIAQNDIVSSWMDAWDLSKVSADISAFIEVPTEGCFKDIKIVPITISLEEAKRRIWSVGGDRGWYALNWAWKLRGLFDQLIGGTGLNRGRRHPSELQPGDSIDFWRVLKADQPGGHLILYAEMKLPGEAWLEFKIDDKSLILTQTATFRPSGLWGRLYWYAMLPFHLIIFRKLAKTLVQKITVL